MISRITILGKERTIVPCRWIRNHKNYSHIISKRGYCAKFWNNYQSEKN